MPEFKFTQNQQNKWLKIFLGILILFVILVVVRYYFGARVLKKSDNYIEALRNIVNQENQPALNEPILKTTDPKIGSQEAEHLIVIFGDFQCPYCSKTFFALNKLIEEYADDLLVVWKDVFNLSHLEAEGAAISARCAQVQGKFWEYANGLYNNQGALSTKMYKNLAEELNLNTASFNKCLDNKETLSLVNESIIEAQALGVDATPYLFIDGQRASGSLSFEQLEKIIK